MVRNYKKVAPPSDSMREKLETYLLAIRSGERHKNAELIAKVTWKDVMRECARDKDFSEAYKSAISFRDDMWKSSRYEEAHHRAMVGVPRSVTCGKGICGTDLIPSDRMMEILLKRDHPEWFKQEVKAEHTADPILVQLLKHIEGSPSSELPPETPQ